MKELPGTFKLICQKVFDCIAKGDAIFSTDTYDPDSIKSMERKRRGTSEKLIIKGESTKRPSDWKAFLANDANKQQFIELLLKQWQKDEYAPKLLDRQVILICAGTATRLTSHDGKTTEVNIVQDLQSSQEEFDTRIALYCQYAAEKGYRYCRVKSPDTDVFFILLHHAHTLKTTILFDTGTGNKCRLLSLIELAKVKTPDYCTSLMALHAFSGCDTCSAFKGIGKIKPINVLNKMPKFRDVLSRLGEAWSVSDEMIEDLDSLTCALYGKPRIAHVNVVRSVKMNDLCPHDGVLPSKNIDISSLPPCRHSLVQHIHRTNYQVGIWKRALEPNPTIPSPVGHGWSMDGEVLEPLWFEGNTLPRELLEETITQSEENVEESEESDGDEEYDLELDQSDIFARQEDSDFESDWS